MNRRRIRKARRAVVEEDLGKSGAAEDAELAEAAQKLIELIRRQMPGAAASIGVDLKDVEAANPHLRDVAASGTGVRIERGRFSGDIDISDVRAGVQRETRQRAGERHQWPAPELSFAAFRPE